MMRRPAQLSLTPRTKEQIEGSVLSWRILMRNKPEKLCSAVIDEIKAEDREEFVNEAGSDTLPSSTY
jgi:hypothetical protein